MKMSWIKYENDNKNFNIIEKLGFEVYRLKNPEEVDDKIEDLVKEKYTTIVLSNDIAYFSENIITKYSKNNNINIIITPKR